MTAGYSHADGSSSNVFVDIYSDARKYDKIKTVIRRQAKGLHEGFRFSYHGEKTLSLDKVLLTLTFTKLCAVATFCFYVKENLFISSARPIEIHSK